MAHADPGVQRQRAPAPAACRAAGMNDHTLPIGLADLIGKVAR